MTSRSEKVRLRLPRDFVGQLMEGLGSLIEQWDNTAEYMEYGESRDDLIIRECSDANEARSVRNYYAQILESIDRQFSR